MRPTHCRVALHEPVGAHHLTQVVDRDRQVTLAQPVTGPGPPHQVGGRLCQVARVGQAADAGVEPADLCGLAHRQRLPPHPVAVRGGRSDSVDDLVQVVLPRGCGRGDPVDLEQVPHRQHRRHGVRPVHRAPALPSTQAASLGLSQHQHQLRPDARGHLAQHGQRRRDLCVAKGPQPVRVRTPQHLARHPGSPQHRATPTRAPTRALTRAPTRALTRGEVRQVWTGRHTKDTIGDHRQHPTLIHRASSVAPKGDSSLRPDFRTSGGRRRRCCRRSARWTGRRLHRR